MKRLKNDKTNQSYSLDLKNRPIKGNHSQQKHEKHEQIEGGFQTQK